MCVLPVLLSLATLEDNEPKAGGDYEDSDYGIQKENTHKKLITRLGRLILGRVKQNKYSLMDAFKVYVSPCNLH